MTRIVNWIVGVMLEWIMLATILISAVAGLGLFVALDLGVLWGAVVGTIVGLFWCVILFGPICLLVEIRDRLIWLEERGKEVE